VVFGGVWGRLRGVDLDFEKASWRRNEPGVGVPVKWVRQLNFFKKKMSGLFT